MIKNRKMIFIATVSLVSAGLLGIGAGTITNAILTAQANNKTIGAGVQLTSVITVNDLGNTYWGKTISPTIRQINSIIKVANYTSSQGSNWHPNQWTIDNIQVNQSTGAGTAEVQVVSWSPDYDTTTGNKVNVNWTQNDPTSPIDLNTAFGGTSGVVNLNATTSYNTWLVSQQKATDIATLKGVDNQTALLKWLDGSNLYNDSLDINQIKINTATSTTGLQWNSTGSDIDTYSVNLMPVEGSNMYTGSIKVSFNVGRTDFGVASVTDMDDYYGGSLPQQPSNTEIFGWFMNSNVGTFVTTENIQSTDVNYGSYLSGERTLTVNTGNEYWTGNKVISYNVDPDPEDLSAVVTGPDRTLSFIETPTFADFMHKLDAKLATSIIWDAIALPDSCTWANITTWKDWPGGDGTYVLTSKIGNLYYSGSVTITWPINY